MNRQDLKNLLPLRPEKMHKGTRGRLLIAGGSEHYPGAPSLSALGALRTGAGVVTLLSCKTSCNACAARLPEIVYHAEDDKRLWADYALNGNFTALVLGMGLERDEGALNFVYKIWNEWNGKILVDGDGLFALAKFKHDIKRRDNAVITPHEGEAARLLDWTVDEVRENRTQAVEELAKKYGCAVLKGHGTLIANNDLAERERVIQINRGGPELAVPGSGDVLAGCIGAFLGMGVDVFNASVLGASIHGIAGDILSRGGVDGVLASEIANTLRQVIAQLRRE